MESLNNTDRPLLRQKNFLIIASVTLMAVLGVSSITPVFPDVQKVFDVTTEKVGLLITVFTLPGIILTPILGVIADRTGRKKILVPALFIFSLAGMACGFAKDFDTLVLLRFLQGLGAAPLGAINVTLLGDLYGGKQRTRAMGVNASILSIGTASYPAIGGALALIGWYVPFLLPVLALPVGITVICCLKNPEPKNKTSLKEYFRAAFRNVADREAIGLFTASVATFIILYGAYLTYIPFLAHNRFGAESWKIGILLSAASLVTAVTSALLGKISGKMEERALIKNSFLLYLAALALIPFMPYYWMLLIPVMLFGVAQGINIPSIMSVLSSHAPLEQRGAFMSINGAVLRGGQTLGPLVMGFFYMHTGLDSVYYAGAAIAGLMFVASLWLIRNRAVKGDEA